MCNRVSRLNRLRSARLAVVRVLCALGLLTAATGLAMAADPQDGSGSAAPEPNGFQWVKLEPLFAPCEGRCAFSIFGGVYSLDGLGEFVDTESPTYVWDSSWGKSVLIGASVSRRLATFFTALDVEGEVGVAQRFGDLTATEIWAALFFRWTKFPWNKFIKTTVALSTGVNYATHIDDIEAYHDDNGGDGGRELLHYLAPEITFALPQHPNRELFLRFHHRSGGSHYWGETWLFGDVGHGSDYGTIGFRFRF